MDTFHETTILRKKRLDNRKRLRSLRTFSFSRLHGFCSFFLLSRSIPNHLQHLPPPPPRFCCPFPWPCFFQRGGKGLLDSLLGHACFFFPPPAPFTSLPFASTSLGYRATQLADPRIPMARESPSRSLGVGSWRVCVLCQRHVWLLGERERERERGPDPWGYVEWCQLFSLMVCAPTGWGDRSVGGGGMGSGWLKDEASRLEKGSSD